MRGEKRMRYGLISYICLSICLFIFHSFNFIKYNRISSKISNDKKLNGVLNQITIAYPKSHDNSSSSSNQSSRSHDKKKEMTRPQPFIPQSVLDERELKKRQEEVEYDQQSGSRRG